MKNSKFLLASYFLANLTYASCGSSFCTVNTNWDTQGLSHDAGTLVDFRYSYAKANEWRAGSSKKTLETPSGSDSEIENKRTINQLFNLNIDYAINHRWGVILGLPLVMRDHTHTFDSSVSDPFTQQAKFTQFGDARVQGKYKFDLANPDSGAGFRFGLKLPTGTTNKTMSPPDPSDPTAPYKLERSSQPGTGSTDGILGGYYFRNTPGSGFGWFVSGQLQTAIAVKDNYRPGSELSLDTGIHYEAVQGLNLLLQLNGTHHARDTGSNANPASGGYTVSISPGISFAPMPQTQIYGFAQLPIIRYVNTDPSDSASGQLSAKWVASIGVTQKF